MERESFSRATRSREIMNAFRLASRSIAKSGRTWIAIYMTFVQATDRSRRLADERVSDAGPAKPFYGGTYFPKDAGNGLPAFREVLTEMTKAWADDRDNGHLKVADGVIGALNDSVRQQASGTQNLTAKTIDETYAGLKKQYDKVNGGFGDKRPQPSLSIFLLRYYARSRSARSFEYGHVVAASDCGRRHSRSCQHGILPIRRRSRVARAAF